MAKILVFLFMCTSVHAQVYNLRAWNCEAKCVAIESDTNTIITAAHTVTINGMVRPNIEIMVNRWEKADLKFVSKYKDLAVLELPKNLLLNKIRIAQQTPPENSPLLIIGTKNYSGVYIGRWIIRSSLDSAFISDGIQKGDSGGAVIYDNQLIGITSSFFCVSNQDMYFVNMDGISSFIRLYNEKRNTKF